VIILGLKKFVLKLLATHATMSVLELFMYILLSSIFQKNMVYQWIVFAFLVALFWFMIYHDSSNFGQNHLKRGMYHPAKGFIAGLIVTIPAFVIYIAALIFDPLRLLFHLWLSPYIRLFVEYSDLMPHLGLITAICFPIISGFSYMDGIRKRNKVLKAIERKNAMRNELSKRNN